MHWQTHGKPLQVIKLVTPLPWCSEQGVTGFVVGVATDRLVLSLFAPGKQLHDQDTITVNLPLNQRTYQFQGRTVPGSEPLQQELLVTDFQALQDLLGQVRKDQHIELCRGEDVESSDRFTGFEDVNFLCYALSEVDEANLDTQISFLGRTFAAPLLITGMTGGIDKGMSINRHLAHAAAALNIPMGIGSQRIALENPDYAPIFDVKRHEPSVFLIGNMGGAQLRATDGVDQCLRAIAMVEANAIAIHLNVLQECIQVEGDRSFSGLLRGISALCRRSPVPVIIKEVGCGIDPTSAVRLVDCGVHAIDVGGRGGTSWGYIEGLRNPGSLTSNLGASFRDWGIPTAYALAAVRRQCPELPLVATGGIRDGLTAAKAVALGAQLVGIGLPLMRAALVSEAAVIETLQAFIHGIRITMMATGVTQLGGLAERLVYGRPLESAFRRSFLDRAARIPN